jgi:anti-sigma-K factor RskA
VTDQASGHSDQFEELAAGYALDALEPADEQAFLRHAGDCPECTRMIASYREVAAAIANVVPPPAEPSPHLADRIMATVRAGLDPHPAPASSEPTAGAAPAEQTVSQPDATQEPPAQQDTPSEAVPLKPRRRWLRPAAAAAAVAAIAGGIWGGLAATSGGSAPTVASCQPRHGCYQTALSAPKTTHQTARVLVQGKSVWVVPTDMKVDNRADQIYVLWQIAGTHLHALGGFDVHQGATGTTIKVGQLAVPYHGTTDFAISLEPGRTVPIAPTKVVSVGAVS